LATEVQNVRRAVDAHQDVLRRNVAMHDLERYAVIGGGVVRGVQAEQSLNHDRAGNRDRDLALRRAHQA